MNWETVTSGIGQHVYALWNNGRKLLTLSFNSTSNFVRIESGAEKRAFILRYEGFLKNKMVMRNEYGIRIGQVTTEPKERLINFNDERLNYLITEGREPQLIIYKDSPENPLAVCSMTVDKDGSILPTTKPTAMQHSLLLALCWYLFRPVVKEQQPQFA